jgi:hypothetical protein
VTETPEFVDLYRNASTPIRQLAPAGIVCSAGPIDLHAVDCTNACVLPSYATGEARLCQYLFHMHEAWLCS